MKRTVSMLLVIVMFTCLLAAPTYAANKNNDGDYIHILSVTPASIGRGETTTFKVTVEYTLQSRSQGEVLFGVNTDKEMSYRIYDTVIIGKGSGTVELSATLTTSNQWSPRVYVNISEHPHEKTWTPLVTESLLVDGSSNPTSSSPHVVYSSGDNGQDRFFKFNENEEIEDLILSTSSYSYNPRLSHFACVMARAAYDQPLLKSDIQELGFDVSSKEYYNDEAYNYDDQTVAYSLAKKAMPDGSILMIVTIRGSYGWSWSSNAAIGISALNGFGKHEGFENDATEIYNAIKSMLGGSFNNVTFFITGHSQGAAAGNLLAVKLYDNGVPASKVYDYNFACPNVACLLNPQDWNPDGVHNNIFNIGNVEDPVTFLPSNFVKAFIPRLSPLSTWGKFGQSYWFFPNETNHSAAGHDLIYYDNALSYEYPITAFATYSQISVEYIMRVIGVHCPVDVTVYDDNNVPVAGVIDNKPQYYSSDFGSVLIFVDGDEKWIFLPADRDYSVRLDATGNGEMLYEVYDVNIANEEVLDNKVFSSVPLETGITMTSSMGDVDLSEVKLYVVDEHDKIVSEVLENGSVVAYNDKPSKWAEAEVEAAIAKGLVPLSMQKLYKQPIPRGNVAEMFVMLIEKSSGKSIDEVMRERGVMINANAFIDTSDPSVLAANALGIINGVGNSRFDPNGTLTRSQIAAIINRVAKVMGIDTSGYSHSFIDVSGHWVDGELGWPSSVGIINGVGDNKFSPDMELTTEQAIAITYRAWQVICDNS